MKEGRKEKDREVKENFNTQKLGGLSKKEIARAKSAAAKDAKQRKILKAQKEAERKLKKQEEQDAAEILDEMSDIDQADTTLPAATDPSTPKDAKKQKPDADEKSAYQMLQDMRWVYRKVKGRRKLFDLIDSDDRQFVFMVKELMRIEAQIMSAKIRTREGVDGAAAQQTVFVVLKGLDETPKNITEKSIANILTPDGADYEVHD